jgi:hypothetical protein
MSVVFFSSFLALTSFFPDFTGLDVLSTIVRPRFI